MSSDGYFDGDDLDDAAYAELNAIEAAALDTQSVSPVSGPTTSRNPIVSANDDSFFDLTLDIDERDLQKLDEAVENAYEADVAGPSRSKSAAYQTTLFGDRLPPPSASTSRSQIQRTKSAPRSLSVYHAPKEKVWDQTRFAKTGLKRARSNGKGKGKATYDKGEREGEEEEEEEEVEFEQFPAPFVSVSWTGTLFNTNVMNSYLMNQPPPMKLAPDLLEAKHWIYPLNKPKRDYQFNITKNCLFKNTIVALPTGLGKTFIAGVVMLNYYRWFPYGKVVFVAPSKPLVAQQIEACHQICGIPGCDAAELTGLIPRATRGRLWKQKRVFYMTPQTLVNDLTTENCDVRDIILLVVDEAHRATGDYAYNQVVRFLMAKNSYFRILALTATPGGNPEAVQNLIDGLHISHIEIRDENSLDIRPYTHNKRIEQHIITMTEDVIRVKDLLSTLMDKDLKPLRQRGVVFGNPDPVKFHPYSAHSRLGQLTKDQRWAFMPLSRLGSLARAMGYLVEGTLGMCHTYLQELAQAAGESGPGKTTGSSMKKTLHSDPTFQAVLKELEAQKSRGFTAHPKMDYVKTLVIQHFAQQLPEEGSSLLPSETRAMVFVTFREAVDEIVEALDSERPLIRAHKFIGQGADKQGKKGLHQKEQLDVINRFKAGEFNVLVATSIGEEGLDIGEVDLIVCYDAQKTPIRMLQRLGRTGRKREGVVHVLLAEGREELNLDKAKDTYKEVQKTILSGNQLELYTDVPRLLPEHIKPECLEKPMEIQEYVRDDQKSPKGPRSSTAGKKRKRNDDPLRNIPTGVGMGFVNVADLVVKHGARRKAASVKARDFDQAGEDDDTERDIETGLVGTPSRYAKVKNSGATKISNKQKTSKYGKKSAKVESPAELLSDKDEDDMLDAEMERGLLGSSPISPPKPIASHPRNASFPSIRLNGSFGSNDGQGMFMTSKNEYDRNMAWLVEEDEDSSIRIVDSSPISDRKQMTVNQSDQLSHARRLYEINTSPSSSRRMTDAEQGVEFVGNPQATQRTNISPTPDFPASMQPRSFTTDSPASRKDIPSSPLWSASDLSSPSRVLKRLKRTTSSSAMPPPILPKEVSPSSSGMGEMSPQPSFPVRQLVRVERQSNLTPTSSETPSPRQRRRLHRRAELEKRPQPRIDVQCNPLFDVEATHSGDEVSEGWSGTEEEEDESDRVFVQELPETQISPSYNQSLAYRQSLFTQAPAGAKAPAFTNGPVRRGNFGPAPRARPRRVMSSSPPADEELDDYAIGSFVVDDEAEILFDE